MFAEDRGALNRLAAAAARTVENQRLADEAARARELAVEAIDKMGDPSAHPDERDERRRRLTKGPPEFREVRVDRPKAKTK